VSRSEPPKSAFPGAGAAGATGDGPTDPARAAAAGLVAAAANFPPGAGYEDRP
jgi:hypothetical protein